MTIIVPTRKLAMKTRRNTMVLGLVAGLVAALGALAQDYSIDWHTIDGGGAGVSDASTGGIYTLSGTIGQPDAGEMSGGAYSLTGGFWFGCVPADCNCDGDVDLGDFVEFQVCFQGPDGGSPETDCACFDFNADADVDLGDFADFQAALIGS